MYLMVIKNIKLDEKNNIKKSEFKESKSRSDNIYDVIENQNMCIIEISKRLNECYEIMKLFVIGNGFDKAHKLKTDYWDFRKFLEANYLRFLTNFEANYDLYPKIS